MAATGQCGPVGEHDDPLFHSSVEALEAPDGSPALDHSAHLSMPHVCESNAACNGDPSNGGNVGAFDSSASQLAWHYDPMRKRFWAEPQDKACLWFTRSRKHQSHVARMRDASYSATREAFGSVNCDPSHKLRRTWGCTGSSDWDVRGAREVLWRHRYLWQSGWVP